MHGGGLARAFGIGRGGVPQLSSVFSALGCLTAELRYTQQQTLRMASADWDQAALDESRAALTAQLAAPFAAAGHDIPPATEVAAIRYSGQSYAVEVREPALDDPDALGAQFRARHEALYGFSTDEPWELQSPRITAAAASTVVACAPARRGSGTGGSGRGRTSVGNPSSRRTKSSSAIRGGSR